MQQQLQPAEAKPGDSTAHQDHPMYWPKVSGQEGDR